MPSLPGLVAYVNPEVEVPDGLMHLYYICFLAGLAISGTVYVSLHYIFPVRRIRNFVSSAIPAGELILQYREQLDDSVETIQVIEPSK